MLRTIVCLGAVLVVTSLTTSAGGYEGAERVHRQWKEYTGAHAFTVGSSAPSAYFGGCGIEPGCVRFRLTGNHTYFRVKIDDLLGHPVNGVVFNGDSFSEVTQFCGETTGKVDKTNNIIRVYPSYGTCYGSSNPSIPTIGVIEVTSGR